MAIRERKDKTSPWQCYWNNPVTGKRESASFATRIEAEKHDALIKFRIRYDRASFHKEGTGKENTQQKQETITLEVAYLLYLKQKQYSKKNLEKQISAMRPTLKKLGKTALKDITTSDLRSLMDFYRNSGVKPATLYKRMSLLRALLRWCEDADLCPPVKFPHIPAAQYKIFVPPTPQEITAMLEVAPPHIVRIIILGSQCGVRVGASEMFQLTWQDFDAQRHILRVHGAKKNIHAPWREVPIKNGLMPLFIKWKEDDINQGIDHIIHFRGKPISEKVKSAWHSTLKLAGITRRIRPYDLRHAFATELIAGGADIGTVAKLMGHSSPNMILTHYQYVMDRQKRSAIECLPDLPHVPSTMCPKKEGVHRICVTP